MTPYGLDPRQLLKHIVRPTNMRLGLQSLSADVAVIGTGLVESELKYVDQRDKSDKPGPAFGLWQMEGPTHADHYRNFLVYDPELKRKVLALATHHTTDFPDPAEMVFNLVYASAMCRVDYRRAQSALPAWDDARGMAEYWKRFYNSGDGKGTVEKALPHFEFAIALVAKT